MLRKDLSLGPGQTLLVQVEMINGKNIKSNMLKIISTNEVVLAENMCDLQRSCGAVKHCQTLKLRTGATIPLCWTKEQELAKLKK